MRNGRTIEFMGLAAEKAPYSLAEFTRDIVSSIRKNAPESPRFSAYIKKIEAAATGLGEAIPSGGGFLLAPEMVNGIMPKVYDDGRIQSLCTKIPISKAVVDIPLLDETSRADGSRNGGIQAYWQDEADTIIVSKAKYRNCSLRPYRLSAVVPVTDELFEDAPGLAASLEISLGKEIAFKLGDAIIRGNGAGLPLGFLNSPALITIDPELGQSADTVKCENIQKMYWRMTPEGRRRAVWIVNDECLPQLMGMTYTTATGSLPVWVPGNRDRGESDTILGHPCIYDDRASALGDVGDVSFVNLDDYILAERGLPDLVSSMHVLFMQGENLLRFVYRVDGQTISKAPITPYKGAETRSSFITLAAR